MTEYPSTSTLRHIGQGACGTVWAAPLGSTYTFAIKREDGVPERSLANDHIMHQKALKALSDSGARICVPRCHQYVSKDDSVWWDRHLGHFPPKHREPCNVLVTDRILPLSQSTRETLTNKYCPEKLKADIRSSEADRDCLIRPYLGRKRHRFACRNSRFTAFSLRNYPLYSDQIAELNLPATPYASIMAETLAMLYWTAHIDANDVEFVLAPPPPHTHQAGSQDTPAIIESPILGEHTIYLLDFDCCRDMPMDKAGVQQAVNAFYRNNPFFPRPGQALWEGFKTAFLQASMALFGEGESGARLPVLWVELVEEEAWKERARKEGGQEPSGD
ncbi:MAG: hypothetical protein Q9222_001510 [Ikaeria aurantiellina]